VTDDRRLLHGIAQQDQGAFREFYDRHGDRVFNVALGFLRQQSDAEEVTQDVFVEVYRSAQRFRGDSSVGTWLHRITVRKSLDRIRHAKRKRRFATLTQSLGLGTGSEAAPQTDFEDPGVLLGRREDAALLSRLIDELPERQRTAFVLCFVQGLSRQEAADTMEVKLKALESLLQRAKSGLRAKLDPHFPGRGLDVRSEQRKSRQTASKDTE